MKEMQPKEYCNLEFSKTVTRWDEAIPLGNGKCGALIWGPSQALRFSLDRGDVWDVTPYPGVTSTEFTYSNMVRLAKEGKEEEIRRIFDAPYNHPLPTKLPAGKLIFDFGREENVCSELNLAQAQAVIQIDSVKLYSFLHAQKSYGMIRLTCSRNQFNFQIENPEFGSIGQNEENSPVDSVNTASLKRLHYSEPELHKEENLQWFIQNVSKDFSYGVFAMAKELENETQIVYAVGTSNDGADWKQATIEMLKTALEDGYESAFSEHADWWSEYWQKSGMTLPNKLFEKNWYLTNYLLASCSRKGFYPMPLQGVWTADDGTLPPWKGDYHHDLNTQMSYGSYLKANHLPEGESFLDYLWSMKENARAFAKTFYNAEGICLPAVMSLDGAALGGWGMYSLSPTNQLWLCQSFERYYRFTGDKAFLEEKAYPYLSQTAEFMLSILEERDGLYYLPISSSSEIHDDTIQAFLTPNSNYDLSLMRYLFHALCELAQELGNGEAARWRSVYAKLPQLAVDENKRLMVSPDESLSESHRHFSHAMAIHPLRLLSYDEQADKEIIDATIYDMERLGTGYWVGFSFTWMAEFYAVQRNGEGAAFQLEMFWRNCCSQNGFNLNGDYKKRGISTFHYRPFTLEANFGAADALQEMLLQSENGVLRLFPAIPNAWREKSVSFRRLRAEKGLLVSAELENNRLKKLVLCPEKTVKIQIVFSTEMQNISATPALGITWEENVANMELCGGKEYKFTF